VVCRRLIPVAVSFLDAELSSSHCVLVHCAAGRDRTAMTLASYLAASSHVDASQAISAVRRARPDALTAEGWEALARRVISSLWR
jgi:protein-tyrosine phosphatase